MTSRFDKYAAGAAKVLNGAMGETAIITPRVVHKFAPPEVDPEWISFKIVGVFSKAPKNSRIQGQKIGGDMTGATRLAVAPSEFWISSIEFEKAETPIKRGDLLTLDDGQSFNIIEPRQDDLGDWDLILTREDV